MAMRFRYAQHDAVRESGVSGAGRSATVSGLRQVNSGDRAAVIPDAFEIVTLVDTSDNEIGSSGKLPAHRDGKLHRAFSILVSNSEGELLLQRRAGGKYHFASLWSNTCCGHPRPGEDTREAAERRLWEEFGFNVALKKLDAFQYRAEDTNSGLIEHEFLHVLHDLPGDDFDWRWSRTTLQLLSVDVAARVLLEQL
jgi:isopentenyl-diphosphate delta-isomerase type 1